MDFAYTDEQQAIRDLAERIFSDRVTHERLTTLEQSETWFDDELWRELVTADLTAFTLPEADGGGAFGILEACLVLEELGRHLAPAPLLPTLLLGGAPIAEFGTSEQRTTRLRPVAERGAVLTAALEEAGNDDPAMPRTTAEQDGDGWRLAGEKVCVPAGQRADCVLVPARTDSDTVGVFLVDKGTAGVAVSIQTTTNREPHAHMLFDGARVGSDCVLGDPRDGARIVRWIVDRALLGSCAILVGVASEALRRTAEYTGTRKQFDRPIATFQAVAMRAADAYVDLECMRSTLIQAAWRSSAGLDAEKEIAAARWWACRGAERVVHTAQHLHGGIGSDVAYPIHRYLLWAKQQELALGGANRHLSRLGAMLAEP